MDIEISNSPISGTVAAISSKSWLHRALLCAALYGNETSLHYHGLCEDVGASIACLRALGWPVEEDGSTLHIGSRSPSAAIKQLPCGESASTLRFFLCLAAALREECRFALSGRLPYRPLYTLASELAAHGYRVVGQGSDLLHGKGALQAGEYSLPGDISSQYISGLLMVLPSLTEDSCLKLTTKAESSPYIALTMDVLAQFGAHVIEKEATFCIKKAKSEKKDYCLQAEGDWSNAAFWLCGAALSGSTITVTGLNKDSKQGDRAICDILLRFGAGVTQTPTSVTVEGGRLSGIRINAADNPDLVPVLAATATAAHGETTIHNISRLRYKESDRLQAITETLRRLGAQISQCEDALVIQGCEKLSGGRVSACGDHRIAMMAAICAAHCDTSVTVCGAEAVKKSYPTFFKELRRLQQ